LLWGVAAIYVAAFVLVIAVQAWLTDGTFRGDVRSMEDRHADYKVSIRELLVGSPYLKSIASVILVSVVVSTLIDFHFKTGAKQAYSSKQELAAFFSLYYGWLNVATLIVQVLFTGRVLSKLGQAPLFTSLLEFCLPDCWRLWDGLGSCRLPLHAWRMRFYEIVFIVRQWKLST